MKTTLLYLLLLFCTPAFCQEYNYIHYDTKDGLAGSTVYRIVQDKKGYIWFATDNGASMFDGKRFINFTTNDGLTDNEILSIHVDSKERVWLLPFGNKPCYYYEGKIHSPNNDSSLKQLRLPSNGPISGENTKGELFFWTSNGVVLLKNSGESKLIVDYRKLSKQYSLILSNFIAICNHKYYPGRVLVFNDSLVFITQGDSAVYFKTVSSNTTSRNDIYKTDDDLKLHYVKSDALTAYKSQGIIGNDVFFNTANGSWRVDSLGNIDPIPFLPGKNVSYSFQDNEGNIWFSTLGEGVYRLTSGSLKTFGGMQESFCIEKMKDRIFAGFADGRLLAIKDLQVERTYPFDSVFGKPSSKRLYALKADPAGNLYIGYDVQLARMQHHQRLYAPVSPIKTIDIIDEKHIVACTNFLTVKVRSTDLKVIDTIWEERGTKVIYDKGFYYIGTLNGLVTIGPDKTTHTTQHIPRLNKRVVDMCKTPDGMWIATNDDGILFYKNGRVDTAINITNGLSSNTCKSLSLKGRYLWIGTNKGVSKLDTDTRKVVAQYSTADGLPSDIINTVFADDSLIWVGSPAGLTYFKEEHLKRTSICLLDLQSVSVSGKKIDTKRPFSLSYRDNNISFDYAAISFKSAGDITYYYKLSGLNDDWKQTRLTNLSYPLLPPGDYTLQLYAVNKFGRQSDPITIQFHITAPFWRTVWFWLASVTAASGLIWYLLGRRYQRLQKRIKEKNQINRQMTELEQAALRAQMNPHFIFNCLNSIQAFVIRNDIEQTNKYISQFASLIRQTLDNSAKANIPVTHELAYLTTYIRLEQMRSAFRFQYQIDIDPEIAADDIFIPSMLLQPFVENAIRHGLYNKKDGTGQLSIAIRQAEEAISFIIEDNGVGREAARKYKQLHVVQYQSKGMALTQNRIEVLNSINMEKITTALTDIRDKEGNIAGTRVTISFPRSVMEKPEAAE